MVWLCGLHSNDVCAVADAIPNRLFFQVILVRFFANMNQLFQCPLMGDFLSYIWDAELYLGLVWLFSYLWINNHIWYPKVESIFCNLEDSLDLLQSPRLATSEQIFGTPWYDGLFIDQVNKSKSKIRSRWKRANSANSFSSSESYDEQKERRDEKGGVVFLSITFKREGSILSTNSLFRFTWMRSRSLRRTWRATIFLSRRKTPPLRREAPSRIRTERQGSTRVRQCGTKRRMKCLKC